jgi:hypothetical protein
MCHSPSCTLQACARPQMYAASQNLWHFSRFNVFLFSLLDPGKMWKFAGHLHSRYAFTVSTEDAGCRGPEVPYTPAAGHLGVSGSHSSPCLWQARCHDPMYAWHPEGGSAGAALLCADHAGAAGRAPAARALRLSSVLCG